jgi:hypothetical protein
VLRKYIPIYIQQDATLHSLFISGNSSTCFGSYLHPSSGAHTTVSTASGICHTVTSTIFMCFVFIWEQTATCVTYSINWLVLITEMKYLLRGTDWLIRSAYNCIYSIWYLSHRYVYHIYVFCIHLRTKSDLRHLHHKLIGSYNRDEKCLQRGTDWIIRSAYNGSWRLTNSLPFTQSEVSWLCSEESHHWSVSTARPFVTHSTS